MQQINELFLEILRAALRGRPFTPTQTLTADQWQSLVQLAAIHKVDPLLWEAVYASGALQRDRERWGLFYRGEDSPENLRRIMEARLDWMDAYYGQYLQ